MRPTESAVLAGCHEHALFAAGFATSTPTSSAGATQVMMRSTKTALVGEIYFSAAALVTAESLFAALKICDSAADASSLPIVASEAGSAFIAKTWIQPVTRAMMFGTVAALISWT